MACGDEIEIPKYVKANHIIFVKAAEGITRTMHSQKMVTARNSINLPEKKSSNRRLLTQLPAQPAQSQFQFPAFQVADELLSA
jgi:hypothetical protein